MTKNDENQLRELVALGDVVNKDEPGTCFVYSEPEVGMPPEVHIIHPNGGRGTFAWASPKACDFVAAAANARPALRALLDEVERLRSDRNKALTAGSVAVSQKIEADGEIEELDALLSPLIRFWHGEEVSKDEAWEINAKIQRYKGERQK